MSAIRFRELDSVEVLVQLGSSNGKTFPPGTRAAIVDLGSDYALIEIVEADGAVHGPYDVALSNLRLVEHARSA